MLDKTRVAMFEARLAALDDVEPGYLARFRALHERLLVEGGIAVVPPLEIDDTVDLVAGYGRVFDGPVALDVREPSACHVNVRAWFDEHADGATACCVGYALSSDGLWRHHSWGLLVETGTVVETTVGRDRYFGVAYRPNPAR